MIDPVAVLPQGWSFKVAVTAVKDVPVTLTSKVDVAVKPPASVTVKVIVDVPVCPETGVYTNEAAPEELGCVIVMFAFGINAVLDELAVITKVFKAPSESPTVMATGPLDIPAHAVEIFDGVEIVG